MHCEVVVAGRSTQTAAPRVLATVLTKLRVRSTHLNCGKVQSCNRRHRRVSSLSSREQCETSTDGRFFETARSAAEGCASVQSDDGLDAPTSAGPSPMSQIVGLSRLGDESQYRMRSVRLCECFGRWGRDYRASPGTATGGPGPSGDRDDDERGQAAAAGAAGRRRRRDGRARCGVIKEAVASARPDIVHEMTALSAGTTASQLRHPERLAATTNRLRTEGTDHLLAAAQATGVSHVVAQSVATWTEGPDGGR